MCLSQPALGIFSVLALALAGCATPSVASAQAVSKADAAADLADLRAKYASAADRYAIVEGVEIAYRDEGEGPVLLLIHGSSTTLRSWDPVAAELVKDFRVIRYDVPPFGLSGPVADKDLSDVEPTDIPAGLLQSLGIGKATVVGTSFGGTTALFLAANNPDLVDRLVILNAPSDPVPAAITLGPSLEAAYAKHGGQSGYTAKRPAEFWQTYFEYYYGQPERVQPWVAEQAASFTRPVPMPNMLALISKVSDNEAVRATYGKVTQPTLLLWGGRDPLLPAMMATRLAEYLPAATVSTVIMEDVGHYPIMEVPTRVAGLIRDYIKLATPVRPSGPNPTER